MRTPKHRHQMQLQRRKLVKMDEKETLWHAYNVCSIPFCDESSLVIEHRPRKGKGKGK